MHTIWSSELYIHHTICNKSSLIGHLSADGLKCLFAKVISAYFLGSNEGRMSLSAGIVLACFERERDFLFEWLRLQFCVAFSMAFKNENMASTWEEGVVVV